MTEHRELEAVEVGVEEWFLGLPDGDGGYVPFEDLENLAMSPPWISRRIAACINAFVGIDTEYIKKLSKPQCVNGPAGTHSITFYGPVLRSNPGFVMRLEDG